MENTHKQEERRKVILRERRKVESELVAQGKKPFYLKKSTKLRNCDLFITVN